MRALYGSSLKYHSEFGLYFIFKTMSVLNTILETKNILSQRKTFSVISLVLNSDAVVFYMFFHPWNHIKIEYNFEFVNYYCYNTGGWMFYFKLGRYFLTRSKIREARSADSSSLRITYMFLVSILRLLLCILTNYEDYGPWPLVHDSRTKFEYLRRLEGNKGSPYHATEFYFWFNWHLCQEPVGIRLKMW